jgi:hypothetical protein
MKSRSKLICATSFLYLLACLALSLALMVALGGCASSRQGLVKEIAAVESATNRVAQVGNAVTPFIPAPYVPLADALLGAATAGLALWGRTLHKRLDALDGQTAQGPSLPPATPLLRIPVGTPSDKGSV